MGKRVPTRFVRQPDPVELATRITILASIIPEDPKSFEKIYDQTHQEVRRFKRRYGEVTYQSSMNQAFETYRLLSGTGNG